MNFDRIFLAQAVAETGFRGEMLEKVAHLLNLLRTIQESEYLRTRLALKGGTALNLFHFQLPRLSVDIDFNYVGAEDREGMLAERPELEARLTALCEREGYSIRHTPDNQFAGGKWQLRYAAARGGQGNIEIDINYMFRVPLWSVQYRNSVAIGPLHVQAMPVMDLHELAAGKLAALLDRCAARDLYDGVKLLAMTELDRSRLRTALTVYAGMNLQDMSEATPEHLNVSADEIADRLLPLLRKNDVSGAPPEVRAYTGRLIGQCREHLKSLLPFQASEKEFLKSLTTTGVIRAELLTDDDALTRRIQRQPMLLWRARQKKQ